MKTPIFILIAALTMFVGDDKPKSPSAVTARHTYESEVQAADEKHQQALKAAEDEYLKQLQEAMEVALTAKDLAEANRIDTTMKSIKHKAVAIAASQFFGRWRIVDTKGNPSFFLTLNSSFKATKSHVPSVTGKWEVVGDEVRVTWGDGWKDILRPQSVGMLKVAFAPETEFTDTPANTEYAFKVE